MSAYLEVMFNTNDPALAAQLRDVDRMPRAASRLRIEAALCQWWANRCLEQAGAMDGRDAMDRNKTELARATRAKNKKEIDR